MKKTSFFLILTLCVSLASAESILQPLNEKGFGTICGRIQSLTMSRDFDGLGNGANSTLGVVLNYTTPEFVGFDAGLGYNYAGEIYENNNSALLVNDAINVLNEGWVRYNFGVLELTNTTVLAGRKINNAEVFRADDFRQKARSIEAAQFESTDLDGFRFAVGHAWKMSNWIQVGDRADFNNFGEVFNGVGAEDTDGITWGEIGYTGLKNLDIAIFDALAWDVANLLGARANVKLSDNTSVLAYLRMERDQGNAAKQESEVIGLSLAQKLGAVNLEGGFFRVKGDNLRFQETTTGINHALGASMIIYSGQFNGDADTAYLKATSKIEKTKTILYALYNYTWQDKGAFDAGQELNVVIKQPIIDNLSIAFKYGIGQRDMKLISDTTAQDARLFITYGF